MAIEQDNLTAKQQDYAIFLPAISSFYGIFIGKQRRWDYVDPARIPVPEMENLNWLNKDKSLFPYKWSLYSAGHANLNVNKDDPKELMVRERDRENTWLLGDSGGFQIGKGVWSGEWRPPQSKAVQDKMADCKSRGAEVRTKKVKDKATGKMVDKEYTVDLAKEYQQLIDAAQKKREQVLTWMDTYMDYGMILDIPGWVFREKNGPERTGIESYQDAVDATRYNNEYFMQNRNGNCKFLNVLQGENHTQADDWYDQMKEFCDPVKYPDTHFNGWAMGGQNMCDVHLILKRLVALKFDNLLQEGIHDCMHFLGTSKLEWATLLTDIQRAVRKYVNPNFQITFDCASPFLCTANGQVYCEIDIEHDKKWSYRMTESIDDRTYATDTKPYGKAMVEYGYCKKFDESPVSKMLKLNDINKYKPGEVSAYTGKETKTSWDSFSYCLLMAHNVWTHITSVQEANRQYDKGIRPGMLINKPKKQTTNDNAAKELVSQFNFLEIDDTVSNVQGADTVYFRDIVDEIFSQTDRQQALDTVEKYSDFYKKIPGTRGYTGENTLNVNTQFDKIME